MLFFTIETVWSQMGDKINFKIYSLPDRIHFYIECFLAFLCGRLVKGMMLMSVSAREAGWM